MFGNYLYPYYRYPMYPTYPAYGYPTWGYGGYGGYYGGWGSNNFIGSAVGYNNITNTGVATGISQIASPIVI